tara:strand:+ start:4209 stop:4478 length:270 start_codon:yes stop_codon:yes gene_type:complete
MNTPKPIIKIINFTDNPDGTASVEFETNDEFDQMYLKETGKKRLTQKGLGNYVEKMITKAVEETDGYSIKKDEEIVDDYLIKKDEGTRV